VTDLANREALLEIELDRAHRALASLTYAVSHDLRAPLRAIDGFSRALLEDYADRLDETGRGHLHRVCGAARRLNDQISGLLRLSRVTSAELNRQPLDLSGLARAAAADLAARHAERCVEVVVEDGITTDADAQLLRVLLHELLDNAFKFTAGMPDPRVEVRAAHQDGRPACAVSDNGVGFDDPAGKLFQPFQRLHPPERFPGIGIGLAVVQRIVDRHGGRVDGLGRIDRGATFVFSLEGGP
jgi:signal transduction histidine kinase